MNLTGLRLLVHPRRPPCIAVLVRSAGIRLTALVSMFVGLKKGVTRVMAASLSISFEYFII
jgi:hypothetical protein